VHVQHELFLYGGAAAVPGIVPALASLRRRRAVVTMHHVVDPAGVDEDFMRTHRVNAPVPLVRAGVAGLHGAIRTLADEVVVHEPSFASVVGGARVVPHGIGVPERADRARARAELGVAEDRLCALCFGFLGRARAGDVDEPGAGSVLRFARQALGSATKAGASNGGHRGGGVVAGDAGRTPKT
jgi:hypothetical protein